VEGLRGVRRGGLEESSVNVDRRAGLLSMPRKIWISKSRSSGSSLVVSPRSGWNGDTGTSDGSVITSAVVNPRRSWGVCASVDGVCAGVDGVCD
jgi:hypothetical protein